MYQVYRQTTESNSTLVGSHPPPHHDSPIRHTLSGVPCSTSGTSHARATAVGKEKQSSPVCNRPATSCHRKAKATSTAFDPFGDSSSVASVDQNPNSPACRCFGKTIHDFASTVKRQEYFVDRTGKSREKRFFTAEELNADGFVYPNFALTDYYHQAQQCPTSPSADDSNPAFEDEEQDLPSCFYCPITQDILEDPVVLPDGHTFSRSVIEVWIRQEGTSPITRRPTSLDEIRPNASVQTLLDQKIHKTETAVHRKRRLPPRLVTKLPSPPRAHYCQQRYANFYSKASSEEV